MSFTSILATKEEKYGKDFWVNENLEEDMDCEILHEGPLIMDKQGKKKRYYFILLH